MSKKTLNKWLQVLQYFAAYLVAAWTFLQFVDWILTRYSISPYWVDLFLWLFIGIIPSLLIYLYHRERINERILLRREKIIFPLNIVIISVGLYIGFGTADLGATTKSIDYTTEAGEKGTAIVTKEEFRTGFYINDFKPKNADSTAAWLEFGISILLNEDLLQNKNLKPRFLGVRNTTDKVREASYFYDFYVDGEFELVDSVFTITSYIRNAKTAEILEQKTVKGTDVLNLIDDITLFVTNTLDSKEINNPNYLDLDVKEFTSGNLKALEHYIHGQYENAIKEDSTFALAYLAAGRQNLIFNLSKLDEQALADKAYQYRNKLPLQKQGETLLSKYLAYDQFEEAEKLVKIQLEVDPSDNTYNEILNNIYGRTKNLEAYTQRAYDAWKHEKNRANGFNFLNAGIIREDYDNILRELNTFSLLLPNDDNIFSLKLMPQLLKGEIESAKKTQEKIKLLHPNLKNLTKVYDTAIAYLKEKRVSKKDLKKFEGDYRSNVTEQTSRIWIPKSTLLKYTSNQNITPLVMAGDYKLVAGHALMGRTWSWEFFRDDAGKIYAYKNEQNDFENSSFAWYWKVDETILKAESFLVGKQLDSAKAAYEKAIIANPKHYYLKDALAHINYIMGTDSITLAKQLKEVAGTYSKKENKRSRRFWIKDGRLLYKRDGLPSKELLPISETRYINMSELQFNFEFEYYDGKPIASYAWRYDPEKMAWEKFNPEVNYLYKE